MENLRLSEKFLNYLNQKSINVFLVCKLLNGEQLTQDELNDFDYLMDKLDIYEEDFDIYL